MNKHSFYKPYFYDQKVYKSCMDSDIIEMNFFNKAETIVVLYWIDYKGDYYDFCVLKPKECIKILSNEKNYWFSRELESGIFLNFFDRHSKIVYNHLLCSGLDKNKNNYKCQSQCIDIKQCQKTLYDIALLSIIKNGLDIKINKYELPSLMLIDINEVRCFMEENEKFCNEFMKC